MKKFVLVAVAALILLSSCQPAAAPASQSGGALRVLAVETFLAEITQNVAGDRLVVEALIPLGLDPHAFEPTPQDVARISQSQVLVINGGGFEGWLDQILENAGGQRLLIDASAGLAPRSPQPSEPALDETGGDPHFWLDPNNVIVYVETIRDGLSQADPQGKGVYTQNATAYIERLQELDAWIRQQVEQVPAARRLMVTNHESFGYFADRYGFTIAGAIIPSVSSSASPSAQQLAGLVRHIQETGAPALFLETGSSTQLAEQVAGETGAKIVTGLLTHSVTAPDGPAPTYIEMMRYNVSAIVEALK